MFFNDNVRPTLHKTPKPPCYRYYIYFCPVFNDNIFIVLKSLKLPIFFCLPPLFSRMEGTEHGPNTPEPAKRFVVGDLVHVYQGTAPGTPGKKTEAFIGRVVGYDAQHQKWLVCDLCYTLYVCCLLLPSLVLLMDALLHVHIVDAQ